MTTNAATQKIQGFRRGRLTAAERSAELIRRPWARKERLVVIHGFIGRLCIAVEPLLCGAMFLALTIGTCIVKTDPTRPTEHNMIILAPIFGFGVISCAIYAFAVMLAPVRALFHTFRPIYIVDGYVRYRATDANSPVDSNGYVAVLTEDRSVACEWPTLGELPLGDHVHPAHSEFSEYGGIHRIDGRLTGVLPERIARFGVGITKRREIIP